MKNENSVRNNWMIYLNMEYIAKALIILAEKGSF